MVSPRSSNRDGYLGAVPKQGAVPKLGDRHLDQPRPLQGSHRPDYNNLRLPDERGGFLPGLEPEANLGSARRPNRSSQYPGRGELPGSVSGYNPEANRPAHGLGNPGLPYRQVPPKMIFGVIQIQRLT